MTSNAPTKCCTIGVLHEGTPTGEIKAIGETPTYFAYPPSRSTEYAVLILTDVIGYTSTNVQLVADQFAANGYFVVMPDLFHGDPVKLNRDPGYDIMKWLEGHPADIVDPVVEEVLAAMKKDYGVKKIGAVGHCFGAKYAIRFLSAAVSCAYVAHPAFVTSEELRAVKGPLSISACEHDDSFTVEKRYESEAILREVGVPYQINLFSHADHGFSVRSDMSIRAIRWAKEQAFVQAVQWLDEHLKRDSQ
ncbi:hypothetical protein FGG08_004919 [Glutinoglossum americanum]|uniref:Dienelactone hydrolase domain-containing protein n=1 Tax=Glutinoglossum americanum TaxID=1670608 RepID=A0A9P8KWI7_9PEZI|nr:hypothetical protein FGG08_004919 [Glutinoglossum americanum]